MRDVVQEGSQLRSRWKVDINYGYLTQLPSNIYWLETIALANSDVTLSLSQVSLFMLTQVSSMCLLKWHPQVSPSSVILTDHPQAHWDMATCHLHHKWQLYFSHGIVPSPGSFSYQVYFITWFYQCRHQDFPALTEDSLTHPGLKSRFCLSCNWWAFFSVVEICRFLSHSYSHVTYL